jgi:hypothetical protein
MDRAHEGIQRILRLVNGIERRSEKLAKQTSPRRGDLRSLSSPSRCKASPRKLLETSPNYGPCFETRLVAFGSFQLGPRILPRFPRFYFEHCTVKPTAISRGARNNLFPVPFKSIALKWLSPLAEPDQVGSGVVRTRK